MNPQPVSLADELRKLVERWRKLAEACWRMWAVGNHQAETFKRWADELSTLLDQHVPQQINQVRSGFSGWVPCDSVPPPDCRIIYVWDSDCQTEYPAMLTADGEWEAATERETPGKITHWMERPSAPNIESAHAAEQPKLTSVEVERILCGDVYDVNDEVDSNKLAAALNALLTSSVAPPPQQICGCDEGRCYGPMTGYRCRTEEECMRVKFDKPIIGSDGVVQTGWESQPPVAPGEQPQCEATMQVSSTKMRCRLHQGHSGICYFTPSPQTKEDVK